MKELLNIVNENDEVIGQESREKIHELGLLHREVHVYFATPNRELIFQHRAKDKDTYPDLLDATVGGHVEIGDSYEKTAIKETAEETGVQLNVADLILIKKTKRCFKDEVTQKINNAIGESYLYIFKGNLEDLKIETGKSLGFEAWPIEKLVNLDDNDSKKFIPYILGFIKTEVVSVINTLNI